MSSQQVLALQWMGGSGHFGLGNSNTLATVDVAGAYIVRLFPLISFVLTSFEVVLLYCLLLRVFPCYVLLLIFFYVSACSVITN